MPIANQTLQKDNSENFAKINNLANCIQVALELAGKKYPGAKQFTQVISGKFGSVASLINALNKHKNGTDTLSDWLGVGSDIAKILAGYTGNPFLGGIAVALGLASFVTSETGKAMGNALLDSMLKYGIADPDTGGWLLPPHSLISSEMGIPPGTPSGPDISDAKNDTSPIILDLDGDGVETIGIEQGIYFDHDGNQFAESSGWVAADDGLLVFDRNADGKIDSGKELFGNNTLLANGKRAANGYEALQELDDNNDGVLNSEDSIWQQLQVWQDRNSNAKVDEGELLSLEQAGVLSIDVTYKNTSQVDEQGNTHRQKGNITYIDGSTGESADVWFNTNPGNTRYNGEVNISDDIRVLPWVRGFGNMADLHIAMSQNSDLVTLIQQFVADPQAAESSGLINEIIYCWAGVSDIPTDSRGNNIDARQLAVLEVATGELYRNHINGTVDPLVNAAKLLQKEFVRFVNYTQAKLLAQTVYQDAFNLISVQLTPDLTGLTWNFDVFEAHLNELKSSDLIEHLKLRNVFYSYLDYLPGFSDVRDRLGLASEQAFIGSEENDVLRGNNTDDIIYGREGNDWLEGGSGSDIYLFNAGDGQDTIVEGSSNSGNVDTLRLGEGLNPEDVVLKRHVTTGVSGADSLVITFRGNSTDSITLYHYFGSAKYQIEHITFSDGTDWLVEDIFNYFEDNIPLPLAAPEDTLVSLSLVHELMVQFTAGDGEMKTMQSLPLH